jgi:hypothetical protein
MSAKTPIRGVFTSGSATGLAEFQSGEFIGLTHGGLGASLSIGSAGQVLKVNSGATSLEFGNVEAIVNIDGATDLESATLAVGDKLLISDGGTEGRALLSQVDTLFSGTTKTLTNKTISGSSNTLSNIGNSSLSNSSVNFGGVTVSLGASDTTPAFDLSDATNYPTSSLTGTITNAQLDGSIANDKLSNSTVSYGGVSLALGASDSTPAFDLSDATNYPTSSLTGTITNAQLDGSIANDKLANSSITVTDGSNSTATALGGTITFAGTNNEVTVAESSGTVTIGLPDNVTIAGNLTVSGTTTEVSSTTINVADPLLSMATNNNSADAVDIGFYGLYDTSGSQDLYAGLFRDASDSGKFKLFKDNQAEPTTTVNTSGTGYTVATLVANLEGNVTGNVTGNADTSTALATARNIGGVSFDGSSNINLPGVNTSGNQDTSGNAATATTLETARTINNVSFDGSANIDVGTVTSGSTSITSSLGSMALNSERLDTPIGFITINIGGTNYKMPYYSA